MNDHDNVIKFVSSLTSIAAETDLSGHRLFKCTSGDCVESKGYVLGGTDATAKIYSNFGENWAPVTDGACAADGDIGNTYLATSKIQLCMPISGTPTKTDVAASSYLLKKANTSYKKYTGNAATSTIVIMEEPGKKFIKFFFHKNIKYKIMMNISLKLMMPIRHISMLVKVLNIRPNQLQLSTSIKQ